uniref:Uncharacterized protein n=1 Tax=Gossypium raimondii TaxID=29730 RepID=A0A0D2R4N1_GOSRA|nr:hypothetical protein B456_002G120500 [Gossypium raimondii]
MYYKLCASKHLTSLFYFAAKNQSMHQSSITTIPSKVGARKAAYHEPRFIGGDGIMSYFHGRKDKEFHLVSDMFISMLILLARETRREEKNVPTCLLFSSSKIYERMLSLCI